LDMERIDIRFRVNRQRANAQLLASANNPQRNFSAIGDQNFFKHRNVLRQPLRLLQASASLAESPAWADRPCVCPTIRFRYCDHRTRKRTCPNCTGLPFSTPTSAMTPFVSALISFITFMASMMQTTVSSVTCAPTSTNGAASGEAA
jgi:hypothetical protein